MCSAKVRSSLVAFPLTQMPSDVQLCGTSHSNGPLGYKHVSATWRPLETFGTKRLTILYSPVFRVPPKMMAVFWLPFKSPTKDTRRKGRKPPGRTDPGSTEAAIGLNRGIGDKCAASECLCKEKIWLWLKNMYQNCTWVNKTQD